MQEQLDRFEQRIESRHKEIIERISKVEAAAVTSQVAFQNALNEHFSRVDIILTKYYLTKSELEMRLLNIKQDAEAELEQEIAKFEKSFTRAGAVLMAVLTMILSVAGVLVGLK